MLNAFFDHISRIEQLDSLGEYDFNVPSSIRIPWLLEILKNPDAVSTMEVLEGPTDTSANSDGSSGEVVLRSQAKHQGDQFQDLTIYVSYWHEFPYKDGFPEPHGTIQINDTSTGNMIENLGLKMDSSPKAIFDLVLRKQQLNPAER